MKRKAKSSERSANWVENLAVKKVDDGFEFQNKRTGNGGCCVSLAVNWKQLDPKKKPDPPKPGFTKEQK